MNNPLPFGDPCPKCGAASAHDDQRDRVCMCTPCRQCSVPTLSVCGYCLASLGCPNHRETIEHHVAFHCIATKDRRDAIDRGDQP